MKHGITLVEIIVAMVVISLAIGPLIHLLSASNKVSNASMYEVMAAHYAAEIGEQLQRLKPWILKDLRVKTGKRIDQLLADPNFQAKLGPGGDTSGKPYCVRLPAPDPETDITFFLSPLDPAFTAREVAATVLNSNSSSLNIFRGTSGVYYNVRITLKWKMNPSDMVEHKADYSVILREDR